MVKLPWVYANALQTKLDDTGRHTRKHRTRLYEASSLMIFRRTLGEAGRAQTDIAEQHIRLGILICEEMKAKPLVGQAYLFLWEIFEVADRMEEAIENLRKAEGMYLDRVASNFYWLMCLREALARLTAVS